MKRGRTGEISKKVSIKVVNWDNKEEGQEVVPGGWRQ